MQKIIKKVKIHEKTTYNYKYRSRLVEGGFNYKLMSLIGRLFCYIFVFILNVQFEPTFSMHV